MSKENKNIPELRFPDFENDGEWNDKKIFQIGDIINGLAGKSGEDFGNGQPYVTYKQVFDNSVIDFQKCGRVKIDENEKQNTLQEGDVLFTTSSETANEVGYASVLIDEPKESTYLNSFCFALRPFNIKELLPQFSRYLFHSQLYRKSITALAQGSTRYNISKAAFLNLPIPVPKPLEQQKIASCLSSLDEVIEAQSYKLELLKGHKKGLMQNLFPQEGEKVPKLRFQEFSNDADWEQNRICNIFKFKQGLQVPVENQYTHKLDGYVRFIRIIDITNPAEPPRYIENLGGNYVIEENDLFMIRYGVPGIISIGYSGIIANNLFRLIWKGEKVFVPKFWFFAFQKIQERIYDLSSSSSMPAINFSTLEGITMLAPEDPREQERIAAIFSCLDKIISFQTEKIEQLKAHKKGLMQHLFPRIDSK